MAEQKFQEFQQKVEKIEQVEKVGATSATTPDLAISEAEEVSAPQKVKFDDALEKADSKWELANPKTTIVAAEQVTKLSPINEMSVASNKIERLKPVTVDQLVEQANSLKADIQTPINKIQTAQTEQPNLHVSSAHDALLTDKLIHVDTTLKAALNKVGVEVTASEIHQTSGHNPLVKFLNYLTNSDQQITQLLGELNGVNASKDRISPDKLLAVQIKLSFVTNEIEFFTNVLNKALDGVKTVMNVQV